MKIKTAKTEDIERLADMWLKVSIAAHAFIPKTYWRANYLAMKDKYLPAVDNYIATDESSDKLAGFISLNNGHIEALFVDVEFQGKGVGQALLEHAKKLYPVLSLAVYERNFRAVRFYQRNGFNVSEKRMDKKIQTNRTYHEIRLNFFISLSVKSGMPSADLILITSTLLRIPAREGSPGSTR